MEEYRILLRGGTGEITEKKSRFIADITPVSSEEEAQQFIAGIRKKYWDARHHCPAYLVGEDHAVSRCSDDGEPSGTAGRPILDVLTGAGLHNVCAVVTRYFGGTLLGTGGLVRAYSAAVQEGLKNCEAVSLISGERISLTMDYGDLGKIQYLLGEEKIATESSDFGEKVSLTVLLPAEQVESVLKKAMDLTGGRVRAGEPATVRFGISAGKPVVFPAG